MKLDTLRAHKKYKFHIISLNFSSIKKYSSETFSFSLFIFIFTEFDIEHTFTSRVFIITYFSFFAFYIILFIAFEANNFFFFFRWISLKFLSRKSKFFFIYFCVNRKYIYLWRIVGWKIGKFRKIIFQASNLLALFNYSTIQHSCTQVSLTAQ